MRANMRMACFVLSFIFAGLFISSCTINVDVDTAINDVQTATEVLTYTPSPPTATPTVEPTPVPTPTPRSGPTVVGIYTSGSGGRALVTEYKRDWVRGEDIAIFYAFASNEPVLNYAPYREMLVDCWFAYPDATNYKIGYQLSYNLVSGEQISVTIRKPSDITHTEYLEVYMYDSVQQYKHGGWYTHLSDEDMDEETLLYSFKLTPGVRIREVESIKLKTFVYKYMDESDFDTVTGEYIGSVSYEIDIVEWN